MRKIIIILFFLFSVFNSFAQTKDKSFTPAIYYTYGSYSNDAVSNSVSFYGTFQINRLDYLTIGFDVLNIDHPEWYYDQTFFVIGGLKNLYPFYLKLNYGYVGGKFDYKPELYRYKDKINILNGSLLYNWNFFYIGGGATFEWMTGLQKLNVQFYEVKFIWMPSTALSFSFMPGYTNTSDGISEISLGSEIFYAPFKFMNLSLEGFVGKRVLYFNPEYMIIYNQPETQKNSYSIITRFLVNTPFNIIAIYQSRDFTDYTINYFTVGLKYRFDY